MPILAFADSLKRKSVAYHARVPLVRKLPAPVIGIILTLAFINVLVWAAVGVVLRFHPALISTATLSYVLGLRHALDADHISAIDLTTRRLVAAGQRPLTVGTFFSLGHSTIVVATSIAVAATAAAVSDKFHNYSKIGGIIGSSVSAIFLILLGIINAWIFWKLYEQLQRVLEAPEHEEPQLEIRGAGCLFVCFKRAFKLIDRPYKIFPVGVLFGLGFDTSSEIAILGISSIQATKGTSLWLIMIFPVLFTAGMCLLDTTDGALMMCLYTSTSLARDQIAILYYSMVLTVITVVVALVIGVIQILTLALSVAEPTGRFWDGVQNVGDHYDIVGGGICGAFVVFGCLSIVLYKLWRRLIDCRREANRERHVQEDLLPSA